MAKLGHRESFENIKLRIVYQNKMGIANITLIYLRKKKKIKQKISN